MRSGSRLLLKERLAEWPSSEFQRTERPASRPERLTNQQRHTRPRLCKRCAASARQRNSRSSLLWRHHFLNQRLKSGIASERIEQRIDFDRANIIAIALGVVLFQRRHRGVFLSKAEVKKRAIIGFDIDRK